MQWGHRLVPKSVEITEEEWILCTSVFNAARSLAAALVSYSMHSANPLPVFYIRLFSFRAKILIHPQYADFMSSWTEHVFKE